MKRKYTDSGAVLTDDQQYRYRLWRVWDETRPRCVFVGLNPSTADEAKDDQTIRKCVGFADRWGFGSIDMVNLFAFRSTEPTALLGVQDPIGAQNDKQVAEVTLSAYRVVAAWGKHTFRVARLVRQRLRTIKWSISPAAYIGCLGQNGDGSPRHPVMLSYETKFEPLHLGNEWWASDSLAGSVG